MPFVADLHLHSSYAYACSKQLNLENIAAWAKIKGLDLLATGDFTHPAWMAELEAKLEPVGAGTYRFGGVDFVVGTEVSCVYQQGGRGRRIHLLLFVSGLEAAKRMSATLSDRGSKLNGDGRPHVGMSARDLTAMALDLDPQSMVVPAHIWTPWYGMLGSKSGFESLEECFGDMTAEIPAVETGLSSDPAMNWAVAGLEGKAIVSFSDAHSLPNLGREATVFRGERGFGGLKNALFNQDIDYTVEFYPEEGKYHLSGHRACGVRQTPEETAQADERCRVCGRPLTLGVLHRVEALASEVLEHPAGDDGIVPSASGRPPFLRLVPLEELLAEALGRGRKTKPVQTVHRLLCGELGGELEVLVRAEAADVVRLAGERVAEAVIKARTGQVSVSPGFDGEYGKVRVWPSSGDAAL